MTRRKLRIRAFQWPRCPPRPQLNSHIPHHSAPQWLPGYKILLKYSNNTAGTLTMNCNTLISTSFQTFHPGLTALIEFFNIPVRKFNERWEIACFMTQENEEKQASILSELVGKRKQENKSRQLILPPKVEAIPSPCQMFPKKEENLNSPPNWSKHLHRGLQHFVM